MEDVRTGPTKVRWSVGQERMHAIPIRLGMEMNVSLCELVIAQRKKETHQGMPMSVKDSWVIVMFRLKTAGDNPFTTCVRHAHSVSDASAKLRKEKQAFLVRSRST